MVVAGRCYARGGGESGTEDDSSGAGLRGSATAARVVGAIIEVEDASTAAGPTIDAVIAPSGSDVLRHEHERDSEVGLDVDRVWCMGQIPPSP